MNKSKFTLFALVFSVLLALLVAPFACSYEDGLEKTIVESGIEEDATKTTTFSAPLADYSIAWIKNPLVSTAVAGVIGAFMMFAIFAGIGLFLRNKRSKKSVA